MRNITRAVLLLTIFVGVSFYANAVTLSETHVNVSCNAGSNGSIDITASAGTAPYSFLWNGGQTTEDRTGLVSANYSVTVTDFLGATASLTVFISQPSAITSSTSVTGVTCGGGNNGAINLTVGGGTPGYTFIWSNSATTEDISLLTAAVYYVTITDTRGCIKIDSGNVTQPPGLVLTKTTTNVTCGSGANGAIDLTVNFGTPGYIYLWNDGATSQDRSGIAAGNYSVTVTDAMGCSGSTTVTVNQSGAGMAVNTTSSQPSCFGWNNGVVNVVSVIGSVGPYSFNWNTGASTQNINSLTTGTYTVTATSTTGCTASASVNLGQPTLLTVSLAVVSVSCNGGNNGAINSTPAGGTAPYSYNWGGGVFTQNRTGLATGTYTVTVTDFKGCTATASAYVPEPLQLILTSTVSPQACTGGPTGSVTSSVTGGTSPYSYWWGGGITTPDRINVTAGTYSCTVTDQNGCTTTQTAVVLAYTPMTLTTSVTNNLCFNGNSGSINLTVSNGWTPFTFAWSNGAAVEDPSGLATGTYTVTVSDNHVCTATATATITQPAFGITINSTIVDATCNGTSTGSISVTPISGSAPYSYNWGGGITSQSRTNLAAGSYSVSVTDANTCTASGTFTVNEPTAISASTIVTNVLCNGAATGAVNLTVSGSFAPYTYSWTGGATTQNLSNIAAGNYTVTITDNHTCTATATATVSQTATPVSASAVVTNVLCNGASTGAINITPNGGTSPYTFNWGGGITTQNRTALAAGTYVVTITDNVGCTATNSSTVTQATAISISPVVTNASCNGGSNGAITLTVNGGTSPYSFNWGGGITTQNRTGLVNGTYTVTVTDNNSCTATSSSTVNQATAVNVTPVSVNVTCNGGNNGSINISVTGGSSPYGYNWGGGVTTQNRTNLIAGNYTVTVTDNSGCTATSTTVITQPAAVVITASVTNVACAGGNTGGINLTVNGGTSPYTYNWGGGITTQNRINLAAGTYNVTVTDNAGCTATNSTAVTQSATLNISLSVTNVTCNGLNNGIINITPSGGTVPYNYNWGGGITSQNRTNLAPGNYSVTVADNAGCTGTSSATITQPAVLATTITPVNITCNGAANGTISTNPSGGTTPYTFNWGGGVITQNRTSLTPGSYNVTITDNNSCTVSAAANITQPAVLSASIAATNVLCNGQNTGAINLTVAGGTSAYSYLWSNSAVTQNLIQLIANPYSVTVTDANLCTATASAIITQPAQITTTVNITNATCFGSSNGAVNVTVNGGAGGYQYAWSNSATTQNITNVPAANYTLNITDANNCVMSTSGTVTEPAQIQINSTQINAACAGANSGSINLTVSGGTTPYNYLWSNSAATQNISNLSAAVYTVTVTDNNLCTSTKSVAIVQPPALSAGETHTNISCNAGNNGSINLTVNGGTTPYTFLWNDNVTTQNRTSLIAGNYSVVVTDANTCTVSVAAAITEPAALSLNIVKTDVICYGASTGSITLNVTGGTAPNSYWWSNNNVNQNQNGLNAGLYNVTVTDANSCTATASTTLTQPSQISVQVNITNVTCFGGNNGSITSVATGGNGGFNFNWSTGSNMQNIGNLTAGSYTLMIRDVMNCQTQLTLMVSQPPQLVLSETHTNVSCNGGNNGAINLTVNGGTPGFNYAWSNTQTTQDISNLVSNNYTVNVTDANTCTASLTINVSQPVAMNLSTVVTDVVCNGASTGAINLTASGGATPYQYLWSNAAVTQNISSVTAGNYSATVTDANACSASTSAVINQSSAIQISLVKTDATCFGSTNGSVNATVTGGNAGYTYNWSNAATTQNISNVPAATYTLIVQDATNCTASQSTTVNQPAQVSVAETHVNVDCNGNSTGSINISPSGGTSPYTYAWSNTAATQNISNLSANSYSVVVTDVNSCTGAGTINVTEPAVLTLNETHMPYACASNAGSIDLTVTGGTSPYNYLWSNAAITQDVSNLSAANYSVVVSDANNCSATLSATITAIPAMNTSLTHVDVTCNGGNNGSVDLTVNGGTTPYTYSWTGGASTQDITGIIAGVYNVVITDANNCTAQNSATVIQPSAIQITHTATNVSCFGGNNGAINMNVTGGTFPYNFVWSNTSTSQNISNLSSGSYLATVTDANNCTMASSAMPVTEPTQINLSTVVLYVGCSTHNDGSIDLSVTGGVPPYSYVWSTHDVSQDISNLAVGSYDVTVRDANACVMLKTDVVGLTPPIQIASTVSNTSCPQVQNGQIDLTVTGGTPQYNFAWSNGAITEDATQLPQGSYSVIVTDSRNCTAQTSFNISYDYDFVIDAIPSTTINLGESIQLSATANVDHNNSFTWTPNRNLVCANCQTATAVPTFTTHYTVVAIDENGCKSSDTLTVTVNSVTDIFIPNAFTPNNDGNNDVLQLFGDVNTIAFLDFKVFNRWGELIFSTNDHHFAWDGTYKGQLVDRGAYIYTMKVVFINGYSRNDYKGSLTILR